MIYITGVIDDARPAGEPHKLTRGEIFARVQRSGEPRELCPCGYCAKLIASIKALGFAGYDALLIAEKRRLLDEAVARKRAAQGRR